ncbi:MAG: phosphoribosylglycinamide formyltransferase [Xanthobacteraceae bacterium]
MARRRVAILISGRGSNMAALIDAARAKDYPAEIALVISNRPDAEGLKYARASRIATAAIDHKIFASREAFDEAVDSKLHAADIEFVCLAGFMRLLSSPFIERWRGRMINIHPSLLPAYKGLNTHARALADGAKVHGCTVHFVVPELDSGPIIMRAEVPVLDGDDEKNLAARVLIEEHRIYPAALKLLAEGRLTIEAGHVVVAGANQ